MIRVAACGICGSDIKAQAFAPAGMVMGHEFGGEVVAVGAQAGAWTEGTNIAVLPVLSCGSCRYCRDGAVSLCSLSAFIGLGPAGGFAEYVRVPARHSFAMPDESPAHFSALVEPYAVGLHAAKSAEISEGDDVLIVGAGGVGLNYCRNASRHCARGDASSSPGPARSQRRSNRSPHSSKSSPCGTPWPTRSTNSEKSSTLSAAATWTRVPQPGSASS